MLFRSVMGYVHHFHLPFVTSWIELVWKLLLFFVPLSLSLSLSLFFFFSLFLQRISAKSCRLCFKSASKWNKFTLNPYKKSPHVLSNCVKTLRPKRPRKKAAQNQLQPVPLIGSGREREEKRKKERKSERGKESKRERAREKERAPLWFLACGNWLFLVSPLPLVLISTVVRVVQLWADVGRVSRKRWTRKRKSTKASPTESSTKSSNPSNRSSTPNAKQRSK